MLQAAHLYEPHHDVVLDQGTRVHCLLCLHMHGLQVHKMWGSQLQLESFSAAVLTEQFETHHATHTAGSLPC